MSISLLTLFFYFFCEGGKYLGPIIKISLVQLHQVDAVKHKKISGLFFQETLWCNCYDICSCCFVICEGLSETIYRNYCQNILSLTDIFPCRHCVICGVVVKMCHIIIYRGVRWHCVVVVAVALCLHIIQRMWLSDCN